MRMCAVSNCRLAAVLFGLLLAATAGAAMSQSQSRRLAYIGSYSPSIPIYELSEEGDLSLLATVTDSHLIDPSWLTISSGASGSESESGSGQQRYLYAVSETDTHDGSGSVSAFLISGDGTELTFINEISSFGSFPCHMALDTEGRYLFVSNYGGGNLAVISIKADGRLGELVQLVDHDAALGAHVHEAVLNEDTSVLQVMDLGLDRVYQYHFDSSTGLLTPPADPIRSFVQLPEGSGPRHLINHPHLNISIVISELVSTVTCLEYDRTTGFVGNVLDVVSTLGEHESPTDMAAAEIQLSEDGSYLYASNRDVSEPNKHRSSISVFSISASMEGGVAKCALLPSVPQASSLGIHPRHFAFTPPLAGNEGEQFMLVANRDSSNIVVLKASKESGAIDQHGKVYEDSTLLSPTQVLLIDNIMR
jgi:6-phosphogluconolactonase